MVKLLVAISLLLGGCAVYKIDVQQGTEITQTMLDQLEYGMPKKKVRFIMGSPAIEDIFHKNRWDYVYTLQHGGKQRDQLHITLFFEEDQLIKVAGDVSVGSRKKPQQHNEDLQEEPIL